MILKNMRATRYLLPSMSENYMLSWQLIRETEPRLRSAINPHPHLHKGDNVQFLLNLL